MSIINPNFTVLNSGLAAARGFLQPILPKSALGKLKSIEIVDGEIPGGYAVDPDRKDVLRVAKSFAEKNKIIMGLKATLDPIQVKAKEEDKCYVEVTPKVEKEKSSKPLTEEEEKSQASLGLLSEILDRAFNRRTTLTSWILCSVLGSFGFKGDDFGQISEILTDANFAKVYTEYKKLAKKSQSEAEAYLEKMYPNDTGDDKQKQANYKSRKLITTASFFIDNYNKLNMNFIQTFPQVFGLQNIFMPWLKWLCPKVKLFDFFVTWNPLLYEISENMGNYVEEIRGIQNTQKPKDENKKVLYEVNLTPLSYREFSLQNIIKNINDAFNRVLGKKSTLSSVAADQILQQYKGEDFKAFSEKFVNDTANRGFIKELYSGLEGKAKKLTDKAPEEKFEKGSAKYYVAKVISHITSFTRSVSPEWVKSSTNTFGAIFVPLNIAMPFLAKIFHKGPLGFITNTLLKLFPLANELLFDHLGNFRKEILEIQKQSTHKSMVGLFPEVKVESKFEALTSTLGYLYDSIKGFASRTFSKKPATV